MASNDEPRPQRRIQHCMKWLKPVRGHVGPHGSLCRQQSPEFVTDVPDLVNVQADLEVSTWVQREQLQNLTAELELLNLGSSTPFSVATVVTSTSVFPAQTSVVSQPAITTSIPVHAALSTGLVESHGLHLPSNHFHGAVAPPPSGAASIRVSAPTTSLASFSLLFVATTADNSQNKNSEDHLVLLFRNFLQQVQSSSVNTASNIPQVGSSYYSQVQPSIQDFRKNPQLSAQADSLLSTLPWFAPALASKGKSAGDLSFFSFCETSPSMASPIRNQAGFYHYCLQRYNFASICVWLH